MTSSKSVSSSKPTMIRLSNASNKLRDQATDLTAYEKNIERLDHVVAVIEENKGRSDGISMELKVRDSNGFCTVGDTGLTGVEQELLLELVKSLRTRQIEAAMAAMDRYGVKT